MQDNLILAFIAGQLRHILTGAAGALVTAGALQADQVEAFAAIGAGLVAYAIGAGWSWYQKRKTLG